MEKIEKAEISEEIKEIKLMTEKYKDPLRGKILFLISLIEIHILD